MQHSHVVIEVFNELPVSLSLVQVLGERLLHPLTLLPQVCHQVLQVGNHSQPTLKEGEFNSSINLFLFVNRWRCEILSEIRSEKTVPWIDLTHLKYSFANIEGVSKLAAPRSLFLSEPGLIYYWLFMVTKQIINQRR